MNQDPTLLKLTLNHTFDAPRPLVFAAWIQQDHLQKWSAPKGFTIPESAGDPRTGGAWHCTMVSSDGATFRLGGVYREVVADERLVFTHIWDEDGTPSCDSAVDVRFTEDEDGGTTMEFEQVGFASEQSRDSHGEGWSECFELLREHLATLQYVGRAVDMTRRLDAPPEAVFAAWTDAEAVQEWWGPECFTNARCELEPHPGGAIRIDMQAPDGTIYPMRGRYREVEAPRRLVFTSEAAGPDGPLVLETENVVTIEQQDGETVLNVHARVIMAKPEAGQYLEGMEAGWSQTLDGLETYMRAKHSTSQMLEMSGVR